MIVFVYLRLCDGLVIDKLNDILEDGRVARLDEEEDLTAERPERVLRDLVQHSKDVQIKEISELERSDCGASHLKRNLFPQFIARGGQRLVGENLLLIIDNKRRREERDGKDVRNNWGERRIV